MDNLTGQKYCNFFEYASFVGIFVRICGLCPSVEWQFCTFEGTDLATLAHLEATATLRSPYTSVFKPENKFSLKTLVYVRIFLYLCTFFCKAKGK